MKRILVFAQNRQTPTIDLFLKIIGDLGLEAAVIDKPRRGGNYGDYDLVLNRNLGMDYCDDDLDLMKELELYCLNPVHAQRICRDKMLCYRWLCQNSIHTPETWMLKDFPRERAERAREEQKKWTLKTQRGMQGRGVEVFDSGKDLLLKLDVIKDDRHIVQDHISCSRELRSVHIGGRVHWFEKDGGNLYQGARAKPVKEISSQAQSLAAHIQSSLGLKFAAVDFLQEGQNYWVVDVNCYPGVGLLNQVEGSIEMVKSMLMDLVSETHGRMKR